MSVDSLIFESIGMLYLESSPSPMLGLFWTDRIMENFIVIIMVTIEAAVAMLTTIRIFHLSRVVSSFDAVSLLCDVPENERSKIKW